jgi:hypothetical protein
MTTTIAHSVSLTPRPGQFPAVIRFRPTGGDDENPGGTGDPNNQPGNGEETPPGSTQGSENPPGDATPPKVITFTPDKLKERLQREAQTTEKELWKKLGVTNAEDAAARLKKLNDLEDAQRSEVEKLQKRAEDAEKEANEYKDIAQREVSNRKLQERNAVIKEAATDAGVNPAYLDVLTPLIEKVITENFEGVEDFTAADLKVHVEKLRTDKPALFEAVKTPAATSPGHKTPPPKPKDKQEKFTVKGMSDKEYNDYLRSKGLK